MSTLDHPRGISPCGWSARLLPDISLYSKNESYYALSFFIQSPILYWLMLSNVHEPPLLSLRR